VVPGSALAQQIGSANTPLSADARRILDAIPNEGTPPTNQHYFRSNEWRLDVLKPHLDGRGGVLVGVGSDQNYTMAAQARSDLLVLCDFDPLMPRVHTIYRVLVSNSETPAALVARFTPEAAAETEALLRRELASDPEVDTLVQHWKRRRGPWLAYLRRVERSVQDGVPFSWLSDPAMYAHIRNLHRNGRIYSRNGDVTATTTLRAIGEAVRRLHGTVRIVYFSNAEQFFPYSDSFIENMNALPTDDRSVVVRTIRHRRIENAAAGDWHYMVHDFRDFVARISTPPYRRSFAFTLDLLSAGPPHRGQFVSTMDASTPRAAAEEFARRGD
jgi:hypothetical protein